MIRWEISMPSLHWKLMSLRCLGIAQRCWWLHQRLFIGSMLSPLTILRYFQSMLEPTCIKHTNPLKRLQCPWNCHKEIPFKGLRYCLVGQRELDTWITIPTLQKYLSLSSLIVKKQYTPQRYRKKENNLYVEGKQRKLPLTRDFKNYMFKS